MLYALSSCSKESSEGCLLLFVFQMNMRIQKFKCVTFKTKKINFSPVEVDQTNVSDTPRFCQMSTNQYKLQFIIFKALNYLIPLNYDFLYVVPFNFRSFFK